MATQVLSIPCLMRDSKRLPGWIGQQYGQPTGRGKCHHQKMAEFLVADFFPWTGIHQIGCHNATVVGQVSALLQNQPHQPVVSVERTWYY